MKVNQQLVAQVPVNVERLLRQYRGNDFFNVDIDSYRHEALDVHEALHADETHDLDGKTCTCQSAGE